MSEYKSSYHVEMESLRKRIADLERRERVLERASSLPEQQLAEVHIRNEQRLTARIADLERKIADMRQSLVALGERYRNCRHGSVNCFCTVEARAVLHALNGSGVKA